MVCENCGFTNSGHASVCARCGAPVGAGTSDKPGASVTIDLTNRSKNTEGKDKLYETRKFIIVTAAIGAIIVFGLIILTITTL